MIAVDVAVVDVVDGRDRTVPRSVVREVVGLQMPKKINAFQSYKTNLADPRGPYKAKPTPPVRLLFKYP